MMMNSLTGGAGFQNIARALTTTVVIFLGFIVLLTLSPKIVATINTMALGETSAAVIAGERFDRVVEKGDATSSDAAWAATTSHIDVTSCTYTASTSATTHEAYTPLGTLITTTLSAAGTAVAMTNCTYDAKQNLYLEYGSIMGLIWQAIGLLLPLGILGALGAVGAALITRITGGSILVVGLVVVLSLLVGSQLLPVVITPLSNFKGQLSGNQYYIYDHGIGTLAKLIGGFYGLMLLGGLLSGIGAAIGVFLKYFRGSRSSSMGY